MRLPGGLGDESRAIRVNGNAGWFGDGKRSDQGLIPRTGKVILDMVSMYPYLILDMVWGSRRLEPTDLSELLAIDGGMDWAAWSTTGTGGYVRPYGALAGKLLSAAAGPLGDPDIHSARHGSTPMSSLP